MKKKILLISIVIVMILSITCMIFTGCKFKEDQLKDFTPPTMEIGKEMPTWDNIVPINKDMSAYEMLQVGIENFYNADYAVIEYNGGVNMKVAGMPVNQVVQSTKIRQGKGDASGNNANKALYFADNKSHSSLARLYEKYIIDENRFERKVAAGKSSISYAGPKKDGKNGRLGKWTVSKWTEPKYYDSLATLAKENSNNPTILWMYDLQESFIIDQIAPIYDEESKTYRFALKFDPVKSTAEYIKVMQVQLESNAGMSVKQLEFLQLILEFVMWENGTIRSINVNEAYKMKLAGIIDSQVKLKATQLFSYDENEAEYKIADHIAQY